MQDFHDIIQAVLEIFNININIWGFDLNLLSVFIATALLSIVAYAVCRLFE